MCRIAELTGFDRKTVRKYLAHPEQEPRYGPRPPRPSLLDAFRQYVDERLAAGVWNAVVLVRELKERGYRGGYSTVKEYLQPKREAAQTTAVRRYETPPGRQAQVDWGHLVHVSENMGFELKGMCAFRCRARELRIRRRKISDISYFTATTSGSILRTHEESFRFGRRPQQDFVRKGDYHEKPGGGNSRQPLSDFLDLREGRPSSESERDCKRARSAARR